MRATLAYLGSPVEDAQLRCMCVEGMGSAGRENVGKGRRSKRAECFKGELG